MLIEVDVFEIVNSDFRGRLRPHHLKSDPM